MAEIITISTSKLAEAIQAGVSMAITMLQLENTGAVSTAPSTSTPLSAGRKGKGYGNQAAIDKQLLRRRNRFQ